MYNMNKICFYILASCLVLQFGGIQGAVKEAEEEKLIFVAIDDLFEIIVVTPSKRSELLKDAPAFVYVILSEDIKDRGYSVLSDIFRDIPGFDTSEKARAEIGTEISVRGVPGNNKTILLVDGIRVNSPGAEPLQLRGDISVRHAERVEIVYGPGSTLYGQDAINSVINIVTQKGAASHASSDITMVAGKDNYKEIFISYSNVIPANVIEDINISTYLQILDADLTDLSDEYPAWWQELYGGSIAAAQGADPPQRWDDALNFNLNLETESSAFRAWYRKSSRSAADGAGNANLYNTLSRWEDQALVLSFSQRHQFSADFSLQTTMSYRRTEVDPESRFVPLIANGQRFFSNRKYGLATGFEINERLDFEINDYLFLGAGLSWESHDTLIKVTIPEGDFDQNSNLVELAGEYSYYTIAGDPDSLVTQARATELHYQNYGAYLELVYEFNDDLSFLFDIRQDRIERIDENPISTRFSAVYHINHNFSLKYIYSEAYAAAAPYFAYVNFATPNTIVTNTDDLKSEEAQFNEINLSWQGVDGFAGLSLYYNTQKNLIQEAREGFEFNTVFEEVYLDEAGTKARKVVKTANGGDSLSKGFDIYARYNIKENMSTWVSFSYVDYEASIEGEKRGLERISPENFRLGMTYRFSENLKLTPSLMYRSTPENFSNLNELDDEIKNPYWINLFVLYKAFSKIDTFLRVDNLTDNKTALKGAAGPLPQETQSFRIGFSYKI